MLQDLQKRKGMWKQLHRAEQDMSTATGLRVQWVRLVSLE
jgi:hypothetical protein